MMGSVTTGQRITPAPLNVSPRIKTLSAVLMFIGLAAFIFTLTQNKERAWHGYLTAYAYFFILAIGGLFFASIQHITKAGWSVNVRRFSEALAAYLPVAFVLGLVMLAGGHYLWEWMDKAAVAEDAVLQHKSGYLNVPFFVIRMVLFFGMWMLFYKKMVGRSLEQDKTGDDNLTHKTVPWSVAFLLFFALSFSLFMVDILMSLQPHWFSTVFGVYCFAGLFQSTMAAMILMIIYCMRKGLLTGWVDENHLHDLGKFMFAFTVFWAYIAYSQYMLMWYANLPEETIFYQPRVTGAWTWVSAALLMGKFVVPFLALLPRWAKRVQTHLVALSIWTLVMQYLDLYWIVYPNLDSKEVVFGLPEILIFAGFAGCFIFVVTKFLSQNPIVPLKDPRIHESLHHHVIY
jgi:hypothetical protein